MPEKKTTKTSTNFEKKVDNAKKVTVETAEKVWAESKKVAWKIWNRWGKSSTEEKIFMCLWIVLILIGLFAFDSVRGLIIPLIIIMVWVLLVAWFFNKSK